MSRKSSVGARVALGSVLAVVAVAAVGVAAASALRKAPAARPTAPAPSGPTFSPIPGTNDSRQLESGVTTAWPTVSLVDTGPADWSRNPAGWDYVPVLKDWRL